MHGHMNVKKNTIFSYSGTTDRLKISYLTLHARRTNIKVRRPYAHHKSQSSTSAGYKLSVFHGWASCCICQNVKQYVS